MTKGERDFNNFLLTPLDMPMEGKYSMPVINGMVMKNFKAPENFVEFHSATKVPIEKRKDTVVHFFTPDFLFERVWYHPNKNLEFLRQFKAVCSPNFSQYTDMPVAMQIWNSYRSKWLSAWWQMNGLRVIPTVNFSDADSFEYTFDGLPHQSLVIISSLGAEKEVAARENFFNGYHKMLEVLEPKQILFYGNKPHWLEGKDENVLFIAPAYKERFGKLKEN